MASDKAASASSESGLSRWSNEQNVGSHSECDLKNSTYNFKPSSNIDSTFHSVNSAIFDLQNDLITGRLSSEDRHMLRRCINDADNAASEIDEILHRLKEAEDFLEKYEWTIKSLKVMQKSVVDQLKTNTEDLLKNANSTVSIHAYARVSCSVMEAVTSPISDTNTLFVKDHLQTLSSYKVSLFCIKNVLEILREELKECVDASDLFTSMEDTGDSPQ